MKDSPPRVLKVGEKDGICAALVPKEKKTVISLFGLTYQIGINVKPLDKESKCFEYICKSCQVLNIEKLKAGAFDSPDIGKLIKDNVFVNSMNDVELRARKLFFEDLQLRAWNCSFRR